MNNQAEVQNTDSSGFITRAWIAEQNRLYSQGYYRRRPMEWRAIQETIDRAAREGKIK